MTWWGARRRRLLKFWGIGVAASVLVTAASLMGLLEGTQAKTLDLVMRLGGQHLASDVVIVAIDDEAFDALGQRQPVSRAYLATLARTLAQSGAAVIGLDLFFSTATSEDASLAAAVRELSEAGTSRVVLSSPLPSTGPLAALRSAPGLLRGVPDVPEDRDGVIRRAALVLAQPDHTLVPAFSTAVTARYLGLDQPALDRMLAAGVVPVGARPGGEHTLRVRPGELSRINFVGPAGSFLLIPAGAIAALRGSEGALAPDNPLRGKVVLVGATFRDNSDVFQTVQGVLPGVEIHANLVHMMLTRSFVQPPAWAVGLLLQVIVVLGAGLVVVACRPLLATAVCLVGPLLLGLPASYLAFHRGGYLIDFMLPVITTRVFAGAVDTLERRRVWAAFAQYVSPQVAMRVFQEAPSLAGERRRVSILFSDLRGFTTLSEGMDPTRIAAHLNEYFDAMTAVIFTYRGMINDFIGDAIMAIFGAPLDDPDHALHAVQTAAAMAAALAALNEAWAAKELPPLRMGIGIHTGEVFAGNVGGKGRIKYTLVGDAVNVASRVEGLNKELDTSVLITEATRAEVGDRVEVRDCGAIPVKGRNEPVQVYEVLAVRGETVPSHGRGGR